MDRRVERLTATPGAKRPGFIARGREGGLDIPSAEQRPNRELVAALLFVGMRPGELSTDTLDLYLTYAGDALVSASLLALLAGVTYLVWAEVEAWRGRGG